MQNNTFKKINIQEKVNFKNKKIAIVQARFNPAITDLLAEGARQALLDSGVLQKNIDLIQAPGSFEIPFLCQQLALTKKYSGIVTVGAIIKGETAHFDYIAKAVTEGILRVSLDYKLPISFGVITTYNLKQAQARSEKNNKGREAALALIETLNAKF